MFSLAFLWLLLLPYLVWTQTTYVLDNTNQTAWTFDRDSFKDTSVLDAYNKSVHWCQPELSPCSGTLMFRGSSVEIYGSSGWISNETRSCQIDFSWPSGNYSHQWLENSSSLQFNVSFVKAEQFRSSEVSYLSFRQDLQCGGLDYAVITVEDTVMPSSGSVPSSTSTPPSSTAMSASTKSSPPIGSIVGGVIGGASVLFLIAGLVVWRWHRNFKQTEPIDTFTPGPPEPVIDDTTPPLNSLAQSAREKQSHLLEPQMAKRASSSVDTDVHPAVQARLQQLEEAIEDIRRSQGPSAPPPAY